MNRLAKPVLAIVGGFLGAGKTTLLLKAAALLGARGLRVAIIMNDQGGELVDTRLASAAGLEAGEVSGGCFCCRFSDFIGSAEALLAHEPDVIFAEPVGSCMDISATILQPLKQLYGDRFRLAPFTVLVEAQRAEELTQPDADPSLAYLFENQIAEADLLCLSKADLAADAPDIGGGWAYRLSAVSGAGVGQWLNDLLAGRLPAGTRLLDIDYSRYAEAEAALGWLNWQAEVRARPALSPAMLVGPLLDELDQALTAADIAIAHLKIFDDSPAGYLRAGLCRNGEVPSVHGALDASPCERHELVLNLRARGPAEALRAIVEAITAKLPGKITVRHFESFSPAPPKPEHRYKEVVCRQDVT